MYCIPSGCSEWLKWSWMLHNDYESSWSSIQTPDVLENVLVLCALWVPWQGPCQVLSVPWFFWALYTSPDSTRMNDHDSGVLECLLMPLNAQCVSCAHSGVYWLLVPREDNTCLYWITWIIQSFSWCSRMGTVGFQHSLFSWIPKAMLVVPGIFHYCPMVVGHTFLFQLPVVEERSKKFLQMFRKMSMSCLFHSHLIVLIAD